MYPASDAFHQAVANNAPQMALFIFNDGIFTNEDIDISAGIQFDDYFCTKTDIGIGEALSNELRFKVMNDKQLLNNFPFGEFRALLGARISTDIGPSVLTMTYGGATYTTVNSPGRRLLKNGIATAGQPGFNVVSMGALDGKIYCFGANNGEIYAVDSVNGRRAAWPDNAFLREKVERWDGRTFSYENRILTINETAASTEEYEFVPLGIFDAERPKISDDIELEIDCYDRMLRLKKDMADISVNYPITLKNLLIQVCNSEGIPVENKSFLNEGVVVGKKPEEFENCSKRAVVEWIAQLAGANAKITRDGELSMAWLNSTSQNFNESSYTDCRPYYYQTQKVDRLCVRDMEAQSDNFVGRGKNTYLIQDNPFLK